MPKRMIKNATILFLSLVGKGANKKKIIWKSDVSSAPENSPTFELEIPIVKTDDEKRMVYGIVYAPDEEDTEEESMTADEIEKASQNFMKARRTDKIDQGHDLNADEGFVAENWIIRNGDPLFPFEKEGAWAVGIKVENNDTWQLVKDGEITGISMYGFGQKENVEKSESASDSIGKKLVQALSKLFSGRSVQKDFADEFNRNTINSAVWALQDALNKIMQDEAVTDKQSAIKESINQFTTFIDNLGGTTMEKQKFDELVASAKELVTKADEKKDQALIDSSKAFLEKIEKEDPEKVTEENFNEFKTEFDGLKEKVEKVEKVEEPGAGSKEPGDKLDEILQEVKNISDRVEKLEKAHGGSRQALGQDSDNGEVKKNYKGLPII